MLTKIAAKLLFLCLAFIARRQKGMRHIQEAAIRCAMLQGVGSGGGVAHSGEEKLLNRIRHKAGGGGTATLFDVGANVGKYSEALVKTFGDCDYSIHAFEASAATFARLASSPILSASRNVRLNNFALGKSVGEATLYSDKSFSGLASLTQRRLEHFGIAFDRMETCRIDTVDTYCAHQGITFIDLLKIDVEGHELDVLEGASGMFAAKAVSFVQFEFGGCNIDTRTFLQDFFYFFKPYGFTIHRILSNGQLQHLPQYSERDEQFVTTNFLAVHENIAFPD